MTEHENFKTLDSIKLTDVTDNGWDRIYTGTASSIGDDDGEHWAEYTVRLNGWTDELDVYDANNEPVQGIVCPAAVLAQAKAQMPAAWDSYVVSCLDDARGGVTL